MAVIFLRQLLKWAGNAKAEILVKVEEKRDLEKKICLDMVDVSMG
jgi:hypothetical protein